MSNDEAPLQTAEVIDLLGKGVGQRRAVAKYGHAVMKGGFVVLPNLLFEAQAHLNVSPTAFNILLHLVQHWWDADKPPHLPMALLARRLRKSPRTLFRYFDELEDAGLMQRQHRFRGRKAQTTSAYALTGLVEKLKAVEPAITKAKKFKGKRVADAEKASASAA